MDLTSTSTLVLFPTSSTQITTHQNTEQYHELARLASSWHLPPTQQQQHYPYPQQHYSYHHQQQQQQQRQPYQTQLPSARLAAMTAQAQSKRRQEREELRRIQITSFRSKDGLLSPPPLPNFVRRKRKSIGSLNPRAMESSPELSSPDTSDTETISSAPGTPPPYGNRSYAATALDLRINTNTDDVPNSSVGLGISGPRSAPAFRAQSSPKRPSPFRNNTLDDAILGVGLIQPPSPSLLRPKSFWKNHPRSALTSLAYSPSSQVVRRSTFVAAGMNIDQGYFDGNSDIDPQSSERPPPTPSKDEVDDKENVDPNSESDSDDDRQNKAVRAFGRSLWNASSLALAVESRTRGISMAEPVIRVPGEF